MSIRSNARPIGFDLSPEFQDVLRRNGMQAHIIPEDGILKLFVQGHDSPMLKYNLNAEQVKKLTDWGTNYANKSAYNTFVDLVDKDFYLPKDTSNLFSKSDQNKIFYIYGSNKEKYLKKIKPVIKRTLSRLFDN